MKNFTLDQIKSEVTEIGRYFSEFCSATCGVGAPFNARTLELVTEAYNYVYLRQEISLPPKSLCEFIEQIADLGESFQVPCHALTDLASKCEVYVEYDLENSMDLEGVATIMNTSEECLEESLKIGDLFYVDDKIVCDMSNLLSNDPRFSRVAVSIDLSME